tara:strand:+ start:203 stop:463 length:261 start_codon:yes stop_codon:yes gene_type:complete
MNTIGLKAVDGKYVVPKGGITDWVYDVYIELDGQLVAVVGFSERQTQGALFWQVDNDKILEICNDMGNRIEVEIQDVAREYFTQHK